MLPEQAVTAIPLGRPLPDASCDRPERRREGPPGAAVPDCSGAGAHRSYLVLLPVGFSVPLPLPAARCALTAPFHPCRPPELARAGLAVYFLWHFPWGHPRRALPGTVPPWSPDFPLLAQGQGAAVPPSGSDDLGNGSSCAKPTHDSGSMAMAIRSCLAKQRPAC
jgi:hypothetical protein